MKNSLFILVLAGLALLLLPVGGHIFNTINKHSRIGDIYALESEEPTGVLKDGVREVSVEAFKYEFSPDRIVVKRNERVRLVISTRDIRHGMLIEKYDKNVIIDPGKPAILEFDADTPGEFTIYCSVYCGPGHSRMKAVLIVQ